MIRLLYSRWFGDTHYALCSACGSEYVFDTRKQEGCADFVDVFCKCGAFLGRVRHDIGGDIWLTSPAQELELSAV